MWPLAPIQPGGNLYPLDRISNDIPVFDSYLVAIFIYSVVLLLKSICFASSIDIGTSRPYLYGRFWNWELIEDTVASRF